MYRRESLTVLLVLHDQGEVLRVEARTADERAVDLGMCHEPADVAGLDATAVRDAQGLGHRRVVPFGDGLPDQLDHPASIAGLRGAAGPERTYGLVGDDDGGRLLRVHLIERSPDLLGDLRLGTVGVALLER